MITIIPGGSPTIVFISQMGGDGASWQPVIDRMQTGAASVTYDRPGIGAAPARPAPNPPLPYSAFADELGQLLAEHQVTGSLVVVGHSVGSLIARMFVDRNPDRIAGIVHVDGSIPRLSLWPAAKNEQGPDGDGPDATYFDLIAGEVEILGSLVPQRTPAAVVSRTPGRWVEGFPAEACDPLWTAYQQQLARQHGCPLVLAEDAGHQIPAEAPRLVAFLIDHVVRRARRVGNSAAPDPDSLRVAGGRFDGTFREDMGYVSTPHSLKRARNDLASVKARRNQEVGHRSSGGDSPSGGPN